MPEAAGPAVKWEGREGKRFPGGAGRAPKGALGEKGNPTGWQATNVRYKALRAPSPGTRPEVYVHDLRIPLPVKLQIPAALSPAGRREWAPIFDPRPARSEAGPELRMGGGRRSGTLAGGRGAGRRPLVEVALPAICDER